MSGITLVFSVLGALQVLGTLKMTRDMESTVEDKHTIGIRGLIPDPTWD